MTEDHHQMDKKNQWGKVFQIQIHFVVVILKVGGDPGLLWVIMMRQWCEKFWERLG